MNRQHSAMHYRADIDGLRAVAVLPVIAFHAGFSWALGGFVGVDVFFVISGYLITRLLCRDLEQGRLSLTTFYERRARRILPALLFVVCATTPLMLQVMTPEELEEYFSAVVATALFVSNLWFWQEAGYFATRAEELPLLHTWSLAIEEQFYVLFPLLLAALWRFGVRPVPRGCWWHSWRPASRWRPRASATRMPVSTCCPPVDGNC